MDQWKTSASTLLHNVTFCMGSAWEAEMLANAVFCLEANACEAGLIADDWCTKRGARNTKVCFPIHENDSYMGAKCL